MVLVVALLLIIKSPTSTTSGDSETQYLKEIERAFVPNNYSCTDGFCVVDDNQIYLNCTEVSMGPECEITTKTFTGLGDLVILIDTGAIRPVGLGYNKQVTEIQKSFTCEHNYIIDTDNKHLFCYQTFDDGVSVYNSTQFNSHYETLNAQTKTVYWTEEQATWTKYNGPIEMERVDFKKNNRMYTLPDINFQAGVKQTFKIDFRAIGFPDAHKYWLGVKPSALTWNEAIAQQKYMVIDPWTADLNTDLIAYWTFNETGAGQNATDSVDGSNHYEGDAVGTATVAGKISTAFNYDVGDDVAIVNTTDLNFTLDTDSFTFAGWIYADVVDTTKRHPLGTGGGTAPDTWLRSMSTNKLQWLIRDKDSTSASIQSASAISAVTWYHVALVWDAANKNNSLWIDGGLEGSIVSAGIDGPALGANFWTFGKGENDNNWDGRTDEWGAWGAKLNKSQIEALYNAGTGITYQPSGAPTVLIIYPVNGTVYATSITDLKYAVDALGDFCWYSADAGSTNSSAVVAGVNFTISTTPLWNNFTVYCNATNGNVGLNTTDFFINKSVGTVLISPTNLINLSGASTSFEYNNTVLNTNLTNSTFYLWWNNNNSLHTSSFVSLSGNDTVNNQTTRTLGEGSYKWNTETCGSEVTCNFAPANFSFIIDRSDPVIVVTNPKAYTTVLVANQSIVLNISITDATPIDTIYYIYNGTTTQVTHGGADNWVINSTIYYNPQENNITIFANDTLGSEITYVFNWTVALMNNGETYNNETTETFIESFSVNLTLGSGVSLTQAYLVWNGTVHAGNILPSGSNRLVSQSITIPDVSIQENVSLFWYLLLNNGTAFTSNTSTVYQIIKVLNIDNCSVYTNVLLNYTIYDEDARSFLTAAAANTTANVHVKLGGDFSGGTYKEYFSDFTTNPITICTQNALAAGQNYRLDSTIQYRADSYVTEYHYIENFTVNSTNVPQVVGLYDLATNNSQEFLITFKNSNFIPVEGALIELTRQYLGEGQFLTVEIMKTDVDGSTIGHFVLNEEIYTIYVKLNGELLATYENVRAFCSDIVTGDCRISLNQLSTTSNPESFSSYLGVIGAASYNDTTKTYVFSFSSVDGSTKTINATVYKYTYNINDTICSEVLSTSSGSITCVIPAAYHNSTGLVKIYVDGEEYSSNFMVISENDSPGLGAGRYLLAFILIITIPLLAFTSGPMMLLLFIVGLITSVGFAVVDMGGLIGPLSAFLWLVIAAIILIIKSSSRSQQ